MAAEHPGPVTSADVDTAVHLLVDTASTALDADWDAPAGALDWSCWETCEHLADSLFYYAAQLSPRVPPADAPVPMGWAKRRPGGPENLIFADREAGPAGVLRVVEVCGALLVAMVDTRPPSTRAHHVFGQSDPEGFAAMGIVETLVHAQDVFDGLGLDWEPPAAVCARTLARLFPNTPPDTDPWQALLWVTGRTELPGRPRLTDWRWYGTPHKSTVD
ncbi:DinB family protein [Actinokineospora sp. NBRC 105648]|uniref:maleylpyruvate isomerase N-terminal domain-containing protein n=1 Tax=Actinokineospora sp. NBRC 105648 TaxID=3032206 RepID=UPI00255620ED|nr:DinB family protein [Actinokineospora sp. NBRC 105648]